MEITRFCPAKINLFLEVTGKRPNGYHELATLFAKIDWCDKLTVQAFPAERTEISMKITGPLGAQLAADEKNIAWKAARIFLDHYRLHARVHITLEKHIPMGAGLGGGSSDGAGVFLALAEMFGKNPFDLLDAAAKLGADVPVFLYEETFLKGEGIGEILTPLCAPGPLPWIVLVYPATPVPTKEVFKRLVLPEKQKSLTNVSNLNKLIEEVSCGRPLDAWKDCLFNRLEECVIPFTASVKHVKEEIQKQNPRAVMMSGSGSTVFALCNTEQEANDLVNKLKKPEWIVSFTKFRRAANENNGNTDTSDGRGTPKSVCQRHV